MRVAALGILLVSGCARLERDDLEGIQVESAELDNVSIGTVGALAGFSEGSGTLVVVDTSGAAHAWPVALGGGMVGLVVDMGASVDGTNRTALTLPSEPITADELLGTYHGTNEDAVLGVGVQAWHLRNKAGVEMEHGWFSAGFGVMVDVAWLRMRIGHGSVDTDLPIAFDTGNPPPPVTGDTSDTADTSKPADTDTDTDTDSQPPPVDTGSAASNDSSSGCGHGHGNGCGGDGGGCGHGCGGGCGGDCGTSGAALILLPLWRLRRRRRA
jgi:hypothetical protein